MISGAVCVVFISFISTVFPPEPKSAGGLKVLSPSIIVSNDVFLLYFFTRFWYSNSHNSLQSLSCASRCARSRTQIAASTQLDLWLPAHAGDCSNQTSWGGSLQLSHRAGNHFGSMHQVAPVRKEKRKSARSLLRAANLTGVKHQTPQSQFLSAY